MAASIPASAIVRVVPNVLGAGGSGLDLVGLLLTDNMRAPIGTVLNFASADDVAAYFGPVTTEATLAAIYFAGYDGSSIKPAVLRIAQYPTVAVPAYIRGGPTGYTLAQLQALSGVLTLTIDGRSVTSGTINLAGATSFSNAATLIQTGLNDQDATVTGAISGTTLTVSAVAAGNVAVGQTVGGASAGTVITALGTGTGGTGTYTVNNSQTLASTTLRLGATTVAYDSVSGAFVITGGTPGAAGTISYATGALAGPLAFTQANGATLSQGAAAAIASQGLSNIAGLTQNFASFTTTFKPSAADMLALATWTDLQQNRFLYAMWDNSITATQAGSTTSVGSQIAAAGLSGTASLYDPNNGASLAAFVMGAIASINFQQTEGRVTLAFRSGSGIQPGVTNASIASNLVANGYNFYGSYATANDTFTFLNPGSVSGEFDWLDSYVNQVWLNAGFQQDLMNLLVDAGSIPYNVDGYALIEAALLDRINQAVNFGAIRAGVTLSQLQAANVNAAAGRKISDTLEQRGWYVFVGDAAPTVREQRGSPPVTFWYTDGGSVQSINLSSVLVK